MSRFCVVLLAALWWPLALCAQQGQTVRIAFIDPLSGPAADIGRNSLKSWQFVAQRLNDGEDRASVRFLIAGFDNKGSPQESLNVLKAVIDQGFRYVVQGNGSGVTAALSDAITRHNQRLPHKAVVLINYAAMDPALTNEKCSFWHFRIEPDTAMKMQAFMLFLAQQPEIRKVYLLNQNYAHGQQFSRFFREAAAASRLPIEVVGDELHPPFLIQDFKPHVDRILASGAQALVTGNWGSDMVNLVRGLQARQSTLPLLAYYPALKGVPTELAAGTTGFPVYQVAQIHTNTGGEIGRVATAFRARHGEDFVVSSSHDGLVMLRDAMARARSIEPLAVARTLSGMVFEGANGPVTLRSADHQLQAGLYVSRWQKTDARFPLAAEATGHTFAPVMALNAAQIGRPSGCQMERP
ncbi:ABC transporter substrate-binding protein [Hydrogenophaga sp. A37]|uniref:ABC transporter substrate-binding protein n=1 Tax=Hydrogenophaga sp. A37 TaxID=1945864 RepID=UPI000985399E|nr:ABC transporter substrate-binding protein [Hydrogenophaga sp. A37]OOG82342.1 branched-chain amino acid ABC transporter substrate-binding protein [Hydrogenophaga sp. A37]